MKRLLFLFLALFYVISMLKAQSTEFWFSAPVSRLNAHGFLMLTNVSNVTANVSLELWNGNTTPTIESITIAPGGYFRKDWDRTDQGVGNPVSSAGTVTNHGMHIVSNQQIGRAHV